MSGQSGIHFGTGWISPSLSARVGILTSSKLPRDYIRSEGLPVFYHGNWEKECHGLYVTLKMRILSIEHPVLGQIRRIETRGLDYKFTMLDDQILLVEAEETPGLVYALSEPIRDWRILVEFQRV